MIKRICFLLCVLPLYAAPVEWGDQEEFPSPSPFYPFSLGGSYANVSPAKFYTPSVSGETLHYIQSDANFAYTHPCSSLCGLIFGAGWVGTDIDWAQNPSFDETNFNYLNLSAGGYTKAFSSWLWTLNVSMFLDMQQFSLSDYTLYQALLWGKYTWNPCLEFDFGFLIEMGLNQDKIWPILGFTYNYSDRLRLHAIYPIDMTLEYDLCPTLTAAGSVRILRNHHRVGENEPLPQAIFVYQTWGIECDLKYTAAPWFFINGFIGSTTQGSLLITNRSYQNGTYYKFNGSLYAGLNTALSF